jgi:hypothetical protein
MVSYHKNFPGLSDSISSPDRTTKAFENPRQIVPFMRLVQKSKPMWRVKVNETCFIRIEVKF